MAVDGKAAGEDRDDEMRSLVAAVQREVGERRLTNVQLAGLIGRHPSAVTNLFAGKRVLRLGEIAMIEDGLDLQRGFFLRAAGLVRDPQSVREVVRNDPDLIPAEREIVVRTYDASRAASEAARQSPPASIATVRRTRRS